MERTMGTISDGVIGRAVMRTGHPAVGLETGCLKLLRNAGSFERADYITDDVE